ncbi:unnamed protein product, partial [Oppiella nova]
IPHAYVPSDEQSVALGLAAGSNSHSHSHMTCSSTTVYSLTPMGDMIKVSRPPGGHLVTFSSTSNSTSSGSIVCSLSPNCSSCISQPQCAWCSAQTPLPGITRCDSSESLSANGCPDKDIVNPASSVEIVKMMCNDFA